MPSVGNIILLLQENLLFDLKKGLVHFNVMYEIISTLGKYDPSIIHRSTVHHSLVVSLIHWKLYISSVVKTVSCFFSLVFMPLRCLHAVHEMWSIGKDVTRRVDSVCVCLAHW